ncbi:MAG: ABC transporter substrate-binding protein, partial [Bauldia litoralis]
MTDRKTRLDTPLSRRSILKGSLASTTALGALSLTGVAPLHFVSQAWAEEQPIGNFPSKTSGPSITLGFNVPQTGAYADEGADELRAYQLAVKHLNGEGDGGMMNTFTPSNLTGKGILGKKVEFVTGDTQTKSDAARASAKRMVEKDGAIMITGGSSSGVAVAV